MEEEKRELENEDKNNKENKLNIELALFLNKIYDCNLLEIKGNYEHNRLKKIKKTTQTNQKINNLYDEYMKQYSEIQQQNKIFNDLKIFLESKGIETILYDSRFELIKKI